MGAELSWQSIVVEAHFVYGLVQGGRTFHVGHTASPHMRLAQHRTTGALARRWTRPEPVFMRILEVCSTETAATRQAAVWARHYGLKTQAPKRVPVPKRQRTERAARAERVRERVAQLRNRAK